MSFLNSERGERVGERIKLPEGILLLRDNILKKGNIFGLPPKEKAFAELPKEGEFLLFSGCGYEFLGSAKSMIRALRKVEGFGVERSAKFTRAFSKLGFNLPGIYSKMFKGERDYREVVRASFRVLDRLGISAYHLGADEPCCGAPLYFLGFHRDFEERAREVYKLLKERGVRRIIGLVPSCTYTLKKIYPQFIEGFDIEVRHILEVIDERMDKGKLPEPLKVSYHDSCILSRYMDIVDEPRRILGRIENLELLEPSWTKGKYSTCCGGGGGFELVFPSLSSMLAERRAEELLELNPDVILTGCPGCMLQLEEGLKGKKPVLDITEIIDRALGV